MLTSSNKMLLDIIWSAKKKRKKERRKKRATRGPAHEYRLSAIKNYSAPTATRRNPSRIRFSESADEIQLFNNKESVDNVARSKTGCNKIAERKILERRQAPVILTIRTAEWKKEQDEPSQRTTATSPPKINQAQDQARTAEWQKKRKEKKR